MTVSRLLERPQADYGDVPQAYKNIQLNLDKWDRTVAYFPQMKASANFWNVSGVSVPDMSMNDTVDESNRLINFNRTVQFFGTSVLAQGQANPADPSTWIPCSQWTSTNISAFVNWMKLYRKYKLYTHSFSEYYDNSSHYSTFTEPDTYYDVEKALGIMCQERGGVNFSDYAGQLYVQLDTSSDPSNTLIENAMLNNATALSSISRGGLLNHRNTPAWDTAAQNNGKRNLFNYIGCLYQVYVIYSPVDGKVTKEFIKSLCNYVIGDNALQQLLDLGEISVKPPTAAFGWLSVTQPGSNYFGLTRYKQTSQGTIVSDDFPNYAIPMMESIELYALIHNKVKISWNDNYFYSDREDHPPVTAGSPGAGLRMFLPNTGFEGVTRYPIGLRTYKLDEVDSYYVPSAKGGEDVPFYIGQFYGFMCDYVGNNNFINYGIRKSPAIASFQTTAKNAPLVAYRTKNAVCKGISNTSGRYCIVITPCTPVPTHYEVQLGNTIWNTSSVLDSTGNPIPALVEGISYLFAIDLNETVTTTASTTNPSSSSSTVSSIPGSTELGAMGIKLSSYNPNFPYPTNDPLNYTRVGTGNATHEGAIIPPMIAELGDLWSNQSRPACYYVDRKGGWLNDSRNNFATDGSFRESTTWQRNNVSAKLKTTDINQLTVARNKGLVCWLNTWPVYDRLAIEDRPQGIDGTYSDYGDKVIAHWEFARIVNKPISDMTGASAAEQYLLDWYDYLMASIKPYVDVVKVVQLGTIENGEAGQSTNQQYPEHKFVDISANSRSDLRDYLSIINNLSGTDAQKVQQINQLWGTQFVNWTDVTYPHNTSNGLLSFGNNKWSLDCQNFRIKQVGDQLCAMARATWSAIPSMNIALPMGQPLGGQVNIVGQTDFRYWKTRLEQLAVSMNATGQVILKVDPVTNDDYKFYAQFLSEASAQDSNGNYTKPRLISEEFSYENPNDDISIGNASQKAIDFLQYGSSERNQDCATAFLVLFNPATQWYTLVKPALITVANNTTKFTRKYNQGTVATQEVIISSVDELSDPLGIVGQKKAEWNSKGGQASKVRIKFVGLPNL